MPARTRGTWYLYALALAGAALLTAGIVEVGAPASSSRTSRQIITAARGVVQATVTGTGNIAPGTDVEANFRSSGTLSQVYVKVGQHVLEGQLLATLDPTSDDLSVAQAQEGLNAAEDQLTSAENGTTGGSTGSSGSASSGSGAASSASTTVTPAATEFVSEARAAVVGKAPSSKAKPSSPTKNRSPQPQTKRQPTPSPSTKTSTASAPAAKTSTATTTTSTTPSPAAIASAQAAVDSADLSLRNAEDALAGTRLYAPATGTVVSLQSVSPGDAVSAGSSGAVTSSGSSGSSSGSGAGSSGSGAGSSGSGSGGSGASSATAGSLGGSSSSSSASSSSGFAEIVDTNQLTMTVAFGEADISKVRVGQPATVTLDALTGVELAAHVSSISTLGTTSSGVVSYTATLTLDDTEPQVRPGMSASAAVITGQAQGVTLPNSAVSGTGAVSTVNVLRNGATVPTSVVVGLRGDSRTQIVSGLSAGARVVVITTLPSLGSSAAGSSTSGTLGGAGGRLGGGGGFGGGGGGGFGGGGGARLFGGGG